MVAPHRTIAPLSLLAWLCHGASAFYSSGTPQRPARRTSPSHRLHGHYLTSALESLAEEKNILSKKDWLSDLSATADNHFSDSNVGNDHDCQAGVPLYPLPAVYLPTGSSITYTLQNMELRNIQMAMDLAKIQDESKRIFCATLRTIDTGVLAKVGTLLRIVDMEAKSVENGQIKKIVLTCVAQKTVEIVVVENPEAADLAYRLRRPHEYLTARIRRTRPLLDSDMDKKDNPIALNIATAIAKDFNRVRDYLIEGFGTDELPPFARQNLADALPALSASELLSAQSFWTTAYQWQTYAHTLREGYQQRLASDRNEVLIAGALKKGGPLNLPVHLTDLLPEDRQQVLLLEKEMQQEWENTGLEPLLDFQTLLVAKCHVERLQRLAEMVARECERLTTIALMPRRSTLEKVLEEPEVRKGAWFDDDW